MCIVTDLKYIITVCYDVIILYNFLPMHSFFFSASILALLRPRKLSESDKSIGLRGKQLKFHKVHPTSGKMGASVRQVDTHVYKARHCFLLLCLKRKYGIRLDV